MKKTGGANLKEGLSEHSSFDANKHAAVPTKGNDRASKRPTTSCGNGLKIKGR